ncbi:dihydrodipicolinate synthase family protein [Polaromonas jejuensis]|uniref:Dihydrodipicolinate synthase family protein n=1 Tax=Polaromonas jejuensis TaxID=457502 RepID=A0ABW0QI29_9BURK|nr:dihydrodipicolinate synthase family protein [Polaromonas jejuensis]
MTTSASPTNPAAFRGIWPALLTPLNADLSIDHAKLAAHCKSLIARGCPGVTPFGTTGEGPSFSLAERKEAIEQLIKNGIPASQIMVSTSCAALPETLELTRHAVNAGAHGCLMLPPFFLKGVSDQGIIDCYRYVIDGLADDRLKLYLYHIPQVTGVGLSHHVIATLRDLYPQTIVGIKDSSCELQHSLGLADAFMQQLTVYVGNEPDLPALGRRGSTGAISGLANFLPQLVHRLVTQPDEPGTVQDLARVKELLAILGGYALIPALKGVMALLSGDAAWLRVRPPLVAMSDSAYDALSEQIRTFGIDAKTD